MRVLLANTVHLPYTLNIWAWLCDVSPQRLLGMLKTLVQLGQLKEDLNIFIEYKASNMIIMVWP